MPYISGSLAISGSLVLFDGTNTVNFTATGSSANFTSSYTTTASYAATSGCTNKVNVFSTASGDTSMFVSLLPDLSTGCQYTYVDQGLRYDAVNNILYTTTEYATNAVLATSASYVLNAVSSSFATTANTINISSSTSTDTVVSLVMVPNQTTGSQPAIIDSKLLYNTATDFLTIDNLEVANNITSSGDLRFTAAGNAVIRPIIDLVPNGTASYNPNSTNTTAYANYGINLITTATSQSYCFRLPQTPVKGKTVTVINNSGINVTIFPSVVGGEINGAINGYAILPSDGKSYSFDCYENPLPGGWSLSSAPSTGNTIVNSGEVTWNYTGNSVTGSQNFTFINNSLKASGSTYGTSNTYDGLNLTQYVAGTTPAWNNPSASITYGQILPDTIPNNQVWKSIDSIQISTNIRAEYSESFYGVFPMGYSREIYYNPANPVYDAVNNYKPWTPSSWYNNTAYNTFNSTVVNPWFTAHPGTAIGGMGSGFGYFASVTYQSIPGTFTTSSVSPYTSDNVGDPGTLVIQYSIPTAYTNQWFPNAKMIGRNYIGTFFHPSDGLCDMWYTTKFCITMGTYLSTPISNIKLQAFYNVQI